MQQVVRHAVAAPPRGRAMDATLQLLLLLLMLPLLLQLIYRSALAPARQQRVAPYIVASICFALFFFRFVYFASLSI